MDMGDPCPPNNAHMERAGRGISCHHDTHGMSIMRQTTSVMEPMMGIGGI
jgi:hypothetical protein